MFQQIRFGRSSETDIIIVIDGDKLRGGSGDSVDCFDDFFDN